MQTKPLKRREKLTFIVDATPTNLYYTTKTQTSFQKTLEKTKYKSYASSHGSYIGFKAIIIIDTNLQCPLPYPSGAPHDSKIFTK